MCEASDHQLSTPGDSHLWRARVTQPETLDLISRTTAECFIIWRLVAAGWSLHNEQRAFMQVCEMSVALGISALRNHKLTLQYSRTSQFQVL
jgi:hypothetical protein